MIFKSDTVINSEFLFLFFEYGFFLIKSKNNFFFQKWSNLHERSGIGWIQRKTKFKIFPIFIFRVMNKKQCGRQFWNAVEHEPVETRVLNPTASEASYKPEQCSYRKTKQIYYYFFLQFKKKKKNWKKKKKIEVLKNFNKKIKLFRFSVATLFRS